MARVSKEMRQADRKTAETAKPAAPVATPPAAAASERTAVRLVAARPAAVVGAATSSFAPSARTALDPAAMLEPITAFNGAALTAWTRSSEALVKGATDVNRELVSLCGRWYDDAVDAPQSLREEPRWEAAIKLAGTATERCFSETAKVMNLVTETVGKASVPWAEFYAMAVPGAFRALSA